MAKNMPPDATPPADELALRMHGELGALLDSVPGSRQVLRMLTTIEHNLQRRGSTSFIDDLPVAALQQALRQLDGLSQTRSEGLKALRAQLQEAVGLHARAAREAAAREMRFAPTPISSFLTDDKLLVREASLSDFDRAGGVLGPAADTSPGAA